MKEDKGKK